MNSDEYTQKGIAHYEAKNYQAAFSFLEKAANLGDSMAMTQLALMYDAGEGVAADVEKSIEWDKKAIALGSSTSMLNLGITYRKLGQIREAKWCFENALKLGDEQAALELARLYSVSDKERDTVKEYLRIAIASNNLSFDSEHEARQMMDEFATK
jgi:uncharacterized protein